MPTHPSLPPQVMTHDIPLDWDAVINSPIPLKVCIVPLFSAGLSMGFKAGPALSLYCWTARGASSADVWGGGVIIVRCQSCTMGLEEFTLLLRTGFPQSLRLPSLTLSLTPQGGCLLPGLSAARHSCPPPLPPGQVVASSLDRLQPVIFDAFRSPADLAECLAASANVPEVGGGGPMQWGGETALANAPDVGRGVACVREGVPPA